jgi:hypothetical protein
VYFVILLNRTCFGRLDNAIAYFPKVTFSEKLPAYILAGADSLPRHSAQLAGEVGRTHRQRHGGGVSVRPMRW